eukprot:jgi/Chrpa1/19198/Chrysochromulina_OHIO_Genome00000858-RA
MSHEAESPEQTSGAEDDAATPNTAPRTMPRRPTRRRGRCRDGGHGAEGAGMAGQGRRGGEAGS